MWPLPFIHVLLVLGIVFLVIHLMSGGDFR